ncbi:helix-turn-helix domain-containing protein [Streptomyces sp. A3M-1-3]|uniref:helix-turn-helix domain-containing protein n=1 Tax=Streptomyces sp. A3M-1-3 TaxID=2962044 RepID=UPI0020B7D0B8|nr:helix-turn-helix domain-containing protein [Streptomyces sp. A3M-1-3]MCP3817943.1 helix-turn-helix domain-containing protein [Streptomyces sp. A3M-1-3]
MRIHRTTQTRAFSTFANALLRDRSISWCAAGVLMYLLSLPSGARASIRSLAEQRKEGRSRISDALRELEKARYLRRVVVKNPESGLLSTRYEVFDTPYDATAEPGEPVVREVGRNLASGEPGVGVSGPLPKEEKTGEKEPPSPPVPASAPAPAPELSPAADLLRSFARHEPRLDISAAAAERLAPLVEQWQAAGVTGQALRAALTDGLPAPIHSPAALLEDRLRRKMPSPPAQPAPAPMRAPRLQAECEECRAPIPQPGRCRGCVPGAERFRTTAEKGFIEAALRGGAAARALLRGGCAAAT